MIDRSNLPETAPEGYRSNQAALLDLVRFGPAFLSRSEFLVLLFHAERSTMMGRESDRHSLRHAMRGIYSIREGRWVRGPAGVAKNSYAKANASLEKKGLIRRWNFQSLRNANHPTEFQVMWADFRKAVMVWKEIQSETLALLDMEVIEDRREQERKGA